MQVTFHRAFDRFRDPLTALEDVIGLGCSRILTSGLRPDVDQGRAMLQTLVNAAADRGHDHAGIGRPLGERRAVGAVLRSESLSQLRPEGSPVRDGLHQPRDGRRPEFGQHRPR